MSKEHTELKIEEGNAKNMEKDREVRQGRWFSRQPSSTMSKLAFAMYLLDTLAGIGGAIALGITIGAPSRDIIIALVTSLVCTILMATRQRWMQVLSLIIGLYLVYQMCTQPYVLSSLMAPKTDPDGGFGHFVGVVLIAMCALLAVCANLGTVLQTFRWQPQQTPRWLSSVLAGIVGVALGVLLAGSLVQPAVATGTTYVNGIPAVHMSAGAFLQDTVTIPKGSQLILVDDVPAIHIIANGTWQNGKPVQANESGAPSVNNVQISSGTIVIGPFSAAGTYHIYCKIHPGMNLTVIVQ
jgi:plastocyanin